MTKRILNAALRLTTNVSKAAAAAASTVWSTIDDRMIVETINKVAEKFEPVVVPVTCTPTGPAVDDYAIHIDLSILEKALIAGRMVQPKIVITAATKSLNRSILADRLIEAVSPILLAHTHRVETLSKRRKQRIEDKHFTDMLAATGGLFDFVTNAIMLSMIGLGSLVGPIFWLIIALGGIAVLTEIPGMTIRVLKEALGIADFTEPEDAEIHKLTLELKHFRPLLQKMVEKTIIVEDAELAAAQRAFAPV